MSFGIRYRTGSVRSFYVFQTTSNLKNFFGGCRTIRTFQDLLSEMFFSPFFRSFFVLFATFHFFGHFRVTIILNCTLSIRNVFFLILMKKEIDFCENASHLGLRFCQFSALNYHFGLLDAEATLLASLVPQCAGILTLNPGHLSGCIYKLERSSFDAHKLR